MSTLVKAWCTCGWHGEYDSQARADFARRRHSCERWQQKRAKARRRVQRSRGVDRTPQPCHHKQVRHQHGTYACYVQDACRCTPCARANADYEQQRTRRNAYGRSNLTDAAPVRAHVEQLGEAGIGLKTLAARSGVSHGALWKLMYGKTRPDGTRTPSQRIRKDTAAAILAVKPDLDTLADGARIDGTGTRRRIQALMACGWSVPRIVAEAGVADRQPVDHALNHEKVLAATAKAIADAYDRLWDTAPSERDQRERIAAARARNRALAAGWAPPLAWDDDAIDDPQATPDLGAVAPVKGGLTADERLDDWLDLVRTGEHPDQAARRAGYTAANGWQTVRTVATRQRRHDVLDWIDLWLISRPDLTERHADDAAHRYKTRRSAAA